MSGSLRGKEIVERARKAKQNFGPSYPKKFGGAVAIEILREALGEEGIRTSRRDVYIRGIPSEIDLIIPRTDDKPWLDLLYEPQQVAIALEIKKTGSFGQKGRDKIRDDFAQLTNAGIGCAYVSLEERQNYKWRPKEMDTAFGYPCFNLAWHEKDNGPLFQTDDWERLIAFLRKMIK